MSPEPPSPAPPSPSGARRPAPPAGPRRPRTRWTGALLLGALPLGLLLPASGAPRDPRPDDGPRRSLEALRREAETRALAASQAVRGALDAVLVDARAVPSAQRERRRPELVERLVELGEPVAPLLVPYLRPARLPAPDPPTSGGSRDSGSGDSGSSSGGSGEVLDEEATRELMEKVRGMVEADESEVYARSIAGLALRQLAGPSVTAPLLDLLHDDDEGTRSRALAVLAHTREPARVAPGMFALFRDSEGEPRAEALAALARLEGPEPRALLGRALEEAEPSVLARALEALAAARSRAAAEAVLAFSRSDQGPRFVQPILAYYRALPDLLEDEHLEALVALTGDRDTPRLSTAAILDTLRELRIKPPRRSDRLLDDLGESASKEVREAALAYLASQGDKRARRDLVDPYDEAVDRQPDYAAVYTQRGDVLRRVFDWSDALKDYKQAIALEGRGRRDAEPYLGAAICYAQQRRYKDAAAYLNRSPYSTTQLRELAERPEFAEMLESRYREAFRLPNE